MELEHLLHCDGIWLHALRYTGPPVAAATMPKSALVGGGDGSGSDVSISSAGEQAVGKVGRRWSFQAPFPSWAAPFKLTK